MPSLTGEREIEQAKSNNPLALFSDQRSKLDESFLVEFRPKRIT